MACIGDQVRKCTSSAHSAARVRCPRIIPEAARQIRDHVSSMWEEARTAGERGSLQACWAEVLQESAEGTAIWQIDIFNGGIDVRAALACRARRVAAAALLPVGSLVSDGRVPKAARGMLTAAWTKLRETARGATSDVTPSKSSRGKRVGGAQVRLPAARSRRHQELIGCVQCAFDDVEVRLRNTHSRVVAHWVPEGCVAVDRSTRDIPERSRWFSFTRSQTKQAQRVAGLQLRRLRQPLSSGVFLVGDALAELTRWSRERGGSKGSFPMPRLRGLVRTEFAKTLRATTAGHLWSAADGMPCDELQLGFMLGFPEHLEESLVACAEAVSGTDMRRLLNQSIHWGSCTRILRRALQRCRRKPRTMAAFGAGLNAFGAAAMALIPGCRYVGFAEAVSNAVKGHDAFWTSLLPGARPPTRYERAETAASLGLTADLVLVSLRCAPFSSANRAFPKGVWAALAELRATMRGITARRPMVIVVENTLGVTRWSWLLAEFEARLTENSQYLWEKSIAKPERQDSTLMRRPRVYYYAVRKDLATTVALRRWRPHPVHRRGA
jgi:hypothetical protein